MSDALHWIVQYSSWGAAAYFLVANVVAIVLLWMAWRDISSTSRHLRVADDEDIGDSRFAPSVCIVAPAWNEAAMIVDSVRALLKQRYRRLEVIVVDDGSTDGTVSALVEAFNMESVPVAMVPRLPTAPVKRVYASGTEPMLTVVQKQNGGKADALNCGINFTTADVICAIDADSLLERDGLARAARPFFESPENVVATGGMVRVANGCSVDRGHVVNVRMPSRLLPSLQVVEYLHSFLAGRAGWSHMNALPVISGAFGMFDRRTVLEVGGYDTSTVGEDAELVVRLHAEMRNRKRDYRIVFVPDPVCWTAVPTDVRTLGLQRDRWQRGLFQTLVQHRRLLLNPRHGSMGMLALPYLLLFELLAPILQLFGLVFLPIGWLLGVVDGGAMLAVVVAATFIGMTVSLLSLAIEELSLRRYPNPVDVLKMVLCAVIEPIGYRQLTAFYQLRGTGRNLVGHASGWGTMRRDAFLQEVEAPRVLQRDA